MKRTSALIIALLTTLAFIGRPAALVPDLIPVQGVLSDLDGNAIDGAVNVRFALYDSPTEEAPLWFEIYSGANQLFFDQGFFTVYLGTLTSLLIEDLLHAEELWLGITVGLDDEMERVRLAAVPFALEAQHCRMIGEFEADDLQPRVYIDGEDDGMCPAGQIIRGINPETGSITCVEDMTTSSDDGTIVGVGGTSPITTETTSGNVTVGLDRAVTDTWYADIDHGHDYSDVYAAIDHGHDYSDVYAAIDHNHDLAYMAAVTCAEGLVLKATATGWDCAADADTTYTAGTGLTLDENTFAADMGHLQQRLNIAGDADEGMCPVGQIIRGINPATGEITCVDDMTTASDDGTIVGVSGTSPITAVTTEGNVQVGLSRTVTDGWYADIAHDHAGVYAAHAHDHDGVYMPAMTCSEGFVLKHIVGVWSCAADDDTTYGAGAGLSLVGTTFSVDFGSGAGQAAAGDHSHGEFDFFADQQETISAISCAVGQVVKYTAVGDWACADDLDTQTTYSAGTALTLSGSTFNVTLGTAAGTAAHGNHHHDSVYSPIGHHHDNNYAPLGHTHDAADVTSGTFSAARIPNLDASKITTGTFNAARIPNLDAGKITSGTLPVPRGGTGATTFTTGNVVVGAGTNPLTTLSRAGIDTRVSFPPSTHQHSAADINSGTLALAHLPLVTVPYGGTGRNTITAGNVLIGDGANPVTTLPRSGIDTRAAFPPAAHNHDGEYWSLGGNAGTTASHYIGTSDNVALNFRVNNQRALRIEPNATSPNIIGGHADNSVAAGMHGATIGGGRGNTVTYTYSTIAGGQNNTANEVSTVGGGGNNSASSHYSTVGGGLSNSASEHLSAVGAGGYNTASGEASTVAGGMQNTASSFASTIAGGHDNSIVGAGLYSTIGGGWNNYIEDEARSTIAGGHDNRVFGPGSSIGGGGNNSAYSTYSTIAGGRNNQATAEYATVSGGGGSEEWHRNFVSGGWGTIGGGRGNHAGGSWATIGGGSSNEATGASSTVSGGSGCGATANYATVAGGENNYATGSASTVAGGQDNTAAGNHSFAHGRGSQANHDGCWVWADTSNQAYGLPCQAPNEFRARAAGGVWFFTNADMNIGAHLPAGGSSWVNASDREMKQNIEEVDAAAVLEKVTDMPVSTWRYKTEVSGALHMGPMAQDFHAAFGLGESDKGIATIDAGGVALAAIKGLNEKLEEENAALREQIDRLEKRLDRIDGGGRSPLALASPLLLLGLLGLGGVIFVRSRR